MKTFGIILKIYLFYLQHSDKINDMYQASSDKSNLNWVRIVISYVQKRAWQRAPGSVSELGSQTAVPVIYNGEVPFLNSPPAPPDTFACQVHPGFGKRQDNSSASCILPSGVTVEPPIASIFASLSSLSAAESASSAAIAASIASVESVSSVQASLSALSAAESASSAAVALSIASVESVSSVQASLNALSAAESASILSAESVSSVQASLNALSAVANRMSALSSSIASAGFVSSMLSPTITPTPPCTQDYVVVGGDTCYSIWTKFGITETDLYSWNYFLNDNCNLAIGQVLCVAWNTATATYSYNPPAPSTTSTSSNASPPPLSASLYTEGTAATSATSSDTSLYIGYTIPVTSFAPPEQPAPTLPPPPSGPDMSSLACVACTNNLGASSCSTDDSLCLYNQCKNDSNCQTCGIDCITTGFGG
jgi:LysM repeat protein